jgi:Uri superfamily endonuclease
MVIASRLQIRKAWFNSVFGINTATRQKPNVGAAFFIKSNVYVYILFRNHEIYYVGSTSMVVEERLRRHLSAHKGFTAEQRLSRLF